MRALQITEVDRDVTLGETRMLLHNPTPIDGAREHLATVTKVNPNGTVNVRVAGQNGPVDVAACGVSIPDSPGPWVSWLADPDEA